MEADQLSALDIEHCILTGKIVERQKDAATGEWKYVVQGETVSGHRVAVISKISATEKLVIITVYLVCK